jgi:DNA polymerase-3 subunit delta
LKIYAEKLNSHLEHQLLNTYLIFGNDPLLMQESKLAIINSAKSRGFEEREVFTLDSQVDWNQIFDSFQTISLFSNQKIVELEIPESGFNKDISKNLVELSALFNLDTLLIIVGNKLTKAQENSKWFKTVAQNSCTINCLTPDGTRLQQFIRQRCQALHLKPDPEATQMLAVWHEGNLLALVQSLEKLTLLYPDGDLNLVRLESALSRHNHYTVFHWSDALLEGKANRSQRILKQLKAEGIEPLFLIRTAQKELNNLKVYQSLTNQMSLGAIFDKYRVWNNKRPIYTAAINRLNQASVNRLESLLAECEVMSKTQYDDSPWQLLSHYSAELCRPGLLNWLPRHLPNH